MNFLYLQAYLVYGDFYERNAANIKRQGLFRSDSEFLGILYKPGLNEIEYVLLILPGESGNLHNGYVQGRQNRYRQIREGRNDL